MKSASEAVESLGRLKTAPKEKNDVVVSLVVTCGQIMDMLSAFTRRHLLHSRLITCAVNTIHLHVCP